MSVKDIQPADDPARKNSTCPKCGGEMINGKCSRCNFSRTTAYISREQAVDSTHEG